MTQRGLEVHLRPQVYLRVQKQTPSCGFRARGSLYLRVALLLLLHSGLALSSSTLTLQLSFLSLTLSPKFVDKIWYPSPTHPGCASLFCWTNVCSPTVLLSASKILSFLCSLCLAKPTPQILSLSWAIIQCYFSSIDEPVKLPAKLCSSTENGIPISKRHPFFQQFMPGTNWVPCWSQWISLRQNGFQ